MSEPEGLSDNEAAAQRSEDEDEPTAAGPSTSSQKRKRKSYALKVKLEAIQCAKDTSNSAAARKCKF